MHPKDNSLFYVLDTLDIIVYFFYPIASIMIVLLAILNDVPVMMIAYDNVHHSAQPERWNRCKKGGIGVQYWE
jgi:H+-transporting ATPase